MMENNERETYYDVIEREEDEKFRRIRLKQLDLPENATDEQIDIASNIQQTESVHSAMIKSEANYIRKELQVPDNISDETIIKVVRYSNLIKEFNSYEEKMSELKSQLLDSMARKSK